MKKVLAFALTALMLLAMVGCSGTKTMTYQQYAAAELDSPVTVDCFVQATQSWWEKDGVGVITVYAVSAEKDGGYFIYNMACSEEDSKKLERGTEIVVTGYKSEWAGEVEITDATFKFKGKKTYIATAYDATELLASEDLIKVQNMYCAFKGMTVEASKDADGKDVAFLYNWDGSGSDGDDLYFNCSVNGKTYTFVIESYLCGPDTDVYSAVKALNVGDVIDMKGFLYWYEGVQPHINYVVPAK